MIGDALQWDEQRIVLEGRSAYGPFRVHLDQLGGVITWCDRQNGFRRTLRLKGPNANWQWEFPYRRLWQSNLVSLLWSLNWWVSWSDPNVQHLSVKFRDMEGLADVPAWIESDVWIDLGRPTFVARTRSEALAAESWLGQLSQNKWNMLFDAESYNRFLSCIPARFAKRRIVESTLQQQTK